jgi:hypothetical protein
MKKILDYIIRHSVWFILGLIAILLLGPGLAELKTLLLIVIIESLALALSGVSHFVYTKLDFTKDNLNNVLGYIFLAVHMLTGMTVLGVYLAQ